MSTREEYAERLWEGVLAPLEGALEEDFLAPKMWPNRLAMGSSWRWVEPEAIWQETQPPVAWVCAEAICFSMAGVMAGAAICVADARGVEDVDW